MTAKTRQSPDVFEALVMYPADIFSYQTFMPYVYCAARNMWAIGRAALAAHTSVGAFGVKVTLSGFIWTASRPTPTR
eukprot:3076252-Pyramimonas_sp.AAC.1